MITSKLNRLIKLLLFAILLIFPFSYANLNANWDIQFVVLLGFIIINLVFKKYIKLGKPFLLSAFSIIFLIIFDYTEKVNFSQQFNIQNPLGWRISLSTIILVVATLALIAKVLIEKKLIFNSSEYLKYFISAITFLITLMLLFYPPMKSHYNMSLNSNIQLLNKVLKYTIISVLILYHMSNEDSFKKINIGLIVSISTGLILNVIL